MFDADNSREPVKKCFEKRPLNFKVNSLNLFSTIDFINAKIKQRSIMVFAKSYSPECKEVVKILKEVLKLNTFEVNNFYI